MVKENVSNYTGIAIPKHNEKGEISLYACDSYNSVGIYSTCLKMEAGYAVALGLGGFNEETAFTTLPERKKQIVVKETYL